MSAPKHLWSGDWESDSEAAARERGNRLPLIEEPVVEPEPEPEVAPREPKPRRQWPRPRVATLVVAVAALLVLAGGAVGLSKLSGQTAAQKNTPWLGANLETVPVNRIVISSVVPGSPADRAGLGPGDVLTTVNGKSIAAPGDVAAALKGLHPGDSVKIQVQRGPLLYDTQATLAAEPFNSP
jgi:membrane-associated protease RseP (regulator of RpoE activity)